MTSMLQHPLKPQILRISCLWLSILFQSVRKQKELVETGKVQLAEGMLNEAYSLFSEAFSILQQVTGQVANCNRYLAMVLYHAGDVGGAIIQQHKELIINEQCLGLDHPDTAHRLQKNFFYVMPCKGSCQEEIWDKTRSFEKLQKQESSLSNRDIIFCNYVREMPVVQASSIWNWIWIWKLDVFPKIKAFLWKSAKNALSVAANLLRRNIYD